MVNAGFEPNLLAVCQDLFKKLKLNMVGSLVAQCKMGKNTLYIQSGQRCDILDDCNRIFVWLYSKPVHASIQLYVYRKWLTTKPASSNNLFRLGNCI